VAYGQGAYGAAPSKTNGLALTSMILGIASVVFCYLNLPLGVVALILGVLGRRKIEESGGAERGSGMALAGIICGSVDILWGVISIILLAVGALSNP